MAGRSQLSEEVDAAGQRHAGEVELEMSLVLLAVTGAVEHRVDPGDSGIEVERTEAHNSLDALLGRGRTLCWG